MVLWACSHAPAGSRLVLEALDGSPVAVFADDSVTTRVFLFTRTDCPVSNRYAPEIQRLAAAFANPTTRFWLVYLDRSESPEQIRGHLSEYGYGLEALRDPRHRLVEVTGARVTPEAAVYAGSELVYRGRIDDRYVAFGRARPEPSTRDLERVLEELAQGRVPEKRTTEAIGCYISDLR